MVRLMMLMFHLLNTQNLKKIICIDLMSHQSGIQIISEKVTILWCLMPLDLIPKYLIQVFLDIKLFLGGEMSEKNQKMLSPFSCLLHHSISVLMLIESLRICMKKTAIIYSKTLVIRLIDCYLKGRMMYQKRSKSA